MLLLYNRDKQNTPTGAAGSDNGLSYLRHVPVSGPSARRGDAERESRTGEKCGDSRVAQGAWSVQSSNQRRSATVYKLPRAPRVHWTTRRVATISRSAPRLATHRGGC